MLDSKNTLIQTVRKRIFSGIIDFFVFSLFFTLLLRLIGLAIDFLALGAAGIILILVMPLFSFIFYFGVFPQLTNGQTVGDFTMGIKTVTIDNSPLKVLKLSRRALSGIFSYIKFLSFRRVFFNPLGQFYYDEKLNMVVIDKKKLLNDFENVNVNTKYEYDFLLDPANLKIFFYMVLIAVLVGGLENFIF